MVEPFWYTDERPHSLAVISGWVRDEAAAIGADYIPGASHWIEHHPEWMADDGLHPNDAGYAHMAAQDGCRADQARPLKNRRSCGRRDGPRPASHGPRLDWSTCLNPSTSP